MAEDVAAKKVECPDCDGRGDFEVGEDYPDWNGHAAAIYHDCERCDGTGEVESVRT